MITLTEINTTESLRQYRGIWADGSEDKSTLQAQAWGPKFKSEEPV